MALPRVSEAHQQRSMSINSAKSQLQQILVNAGIPLVLALITLGIGIRFQFLIPLPDSDQFFHFALSRLQLNDGLRSTLPEVEGLGWGVQFVDKEFFYHLLTTLAYYFAQDQGIRHLALLISCFLVYAIYRASLDGASLRGKKSIPSMLQLLLGLAVLIALPLDIFFLHRLYLVRPHTLAMLFFTIFLSSLLRRSLACLLVSSLFFALSYHALYIPLVVLVVFQCTRVLVKDGDTTTRVAETKLFLAGILGLALGSALHPAFPLQFSMMWKHLWFALTPEAEIISVGAEVRRLSLIDTWLRSPLFYTSLLVLLAAQVPRIRRSELKSSELALILTVVVFAVVTILNPRGIEYLIPLSLCLLGNSLASASPVTTRTVGAITLALLVLYVSPKAAWLFSTSKPIENQGRLAALRAAKAIAREHVHTQHRVFNCTFNTGPYLLYEINEVRFIDLLDPRFLLQSNPSLHRLRNALERSAPERIVPDILDAFPAEFIVCMRPEINAFLDASDLALRLYPRDKTQKAAVHSYRILRHKIQ